jgi:catechol 2,3-dioxygenase-like lactoylglutathione lyase family enzyme
MFVAQTISDFCLLVQDLDAMMRFYRDTIGFKLRRHAPGFADFATDGVTLALWERNHFIEHVGVNLPQLGSSGSISAVEVRAPKNVDEYFRELTEKGVHFPVAPRWYAWNAYACYFEDPEHHLWEIYAWGKQGHAGLLPI